MRARNVGGVGRLGTRDYGGLPEGRPAHLSLTDARIRSDMTGE